MNTAIVVKVSESGKSMLVGHKSSKYQTGYVFGWAANPDKVAKDTVLTDFAPKNRQPISKDGQILTHKDGTPVMAWTF